MLGMDGFGARIVNLKLFGGLSDGKIVHNNFPDEGLSQLCGQFGILTFLSDGGFRFKCRFGHRTQ